jgi:autotransporter-associated beta strand protein
VLVINVPSGRAVLNIPLGYNKYTSEIVNNFERGRLVKRGAGTLKLASQGDYDYMCPITIEEGDVELQTVINSNSDFHYGMITIAEGSTLFLPVSEPDDFGNRTATTVYLWGLNGKGTITNFVSNTLHVNSPFYSKFEGNIWPGANLRCAANFDIMSTSLQVESVHAHSIDLIGKTTLYNPAYSAYEGVLQRDPAIGVMKLGNPGEPSSIGTNGTVVLGNNRGDLNSGGGIRYLGEGETSSKNFSVPYSKDRPAHIDGGPYGGLVLTGCLSVNAYVPGWQRFVFKGDNANPCRFTGTVKNGSKNSTNYNFYVTKQGTGTWSFEGTKNFTGGMAVQDGVLKFDSLDEAGVSSALGTAAVLTPDLYDILRPENMVPYAYVLGGTNAQGWATGKGLLEYAGSKTVRVTTRPAKINGTGGFANNTEASFRFADISAMEASQGDTLVLSGNGSAGNEVQDISGALSVVKEGSGTWTLSGSNTFSGSIEVKAGTLHVRDPAKYSWYRWTVCNTASTNHNVYATEFGLYDKDGRRVNGGLRKGQGERKLAPGEVHFFGEKAMNEENGILENMFDGNTETAGAISSYKESRPYTGSLFPNVDDSSTWVSILMRLPDGVCDVASYDFTILGHKASYFVANVAVWKLDASSDGIRWDEIMPVVTNYVSSKEWYNWWRFQKDENGADVQCTDENSEIHAGGAPLAGRKTSGILPVLNNVSSVAVAAGARFSTDASPSPVLLKGLTVDVNGAGTISNFAFAENGVINVLNAPKASGDVELPGTYENVTGLHNIADWDLYVDGVETAKHQVREVNGKLRLSRLAFRIIVR